MCAGHLLEDGRQEQQIDELWIELRAPSVKDDLQRLVRCTAVTIAAVVRDCVERVRDRDDTCGERNRRRAKSARISGAIPAFVMCDHRVRQRLVKVRDRRQHLGAANRMCRNRTALFGRQLALFVYNVEQSLVNFPNVVKKRAQFYRASCLLVQSDGVGENQSVSRDPTNVCPGLWIVGVDRLEQRFERRRGEALAALTGTMLVYEPGARGDAGGEGEGSHLRQIAQETIFGGRTHVSLLAATLQLQSPQTVLLNF